MKQRPFFSIVTCTRNSAAFIEDNIRSVDSQTCTDYEHIIIDGNSTDDTLKILNNNKREYRKIWNFPPKGISNALNTGVACANGKYIIHLNSDDFFSSHSTLGVVKKSIEQMKFPDVVYGKITVIESDKAIVGTFPNYWVVQQAWSWLLKYINYVPHQATFVRSSVFDKFGKFDESLSSSMDYEYWLRIRSYTRWEFLDLVISFYRVRRGAQSSDARNRNLSMKNVQKVLSTHLNAFEYSVSLPLHFCIDLFSKIYR